MNWRALLTFFAVMLISLPGCGQGQQEQEVYEGLKIADLAPAGSKPAEGRSQWFVELVICFLELLGEHFSASDELWDCLYTAPLQFANAQAFKANGFAAGFGDEQVWGQVGRILQTSRARTVKTISLTAFDEQAHDILIGPLGVERTVFYTETDGRIAGATLANGATALRITAARVPGARGLCRVNVQPVFKSGPMMGTVDRLAGAGRPGDALFDSAGFELKISPGEFVLLGPAQPSPDPAGMTLDGVFFSADEAQQVVRMYLIFCGRVVD